MEMITVTAKTVEDAITQASVQLGVSSDRTLRSLYLIGNILRQGLQGLLPSGTVIFRIQLYP